MNPPGRAARLALGTASALGLARFAYGLLLPAMRDDLGWTLAGAGAMSTANGLGYLVGALLTAPFVRRVGTATAFRLGMAVTAATLAATALSADFAVLLAVRAASGVSGAVVFVTGGVIASRLGGASLTVYFAGAGLGIALSGATIPALGDHWRTAWVGMGLAAAVATAVSWTAARADGTPGTAAGRAKLRPLAPIAVAYALFATGYIAYITFLSAYLEDRHAPVLQVALTWTALGLAVVVAPAVWNRAITTWRDARALAALLAVLGAGAALALVSSAAPVVLASAVLYGSAMMGVPAAVTALIKARVADPTATLAAFTTLFAAGQTAGPWLAGLVADRTSTDATLVWTAVLCWAGALVAARVRTPVAA